MGGCALILNQNSYLARICMRPYDFRPGIQVPSKKWKYSFLCRQRCLYTMPLANSFHTPNALVIGGAKKGYASIVPSNL